MKPEVFAKKLIDRINSNLETYDEDIEMTFIIINEEEKSIKGSCPVCTHQDLCELFGFNVPIGRIKEFLTETKEILIPMVHEELAKKPKTAVEAMLKVIYFNSFNVEYEGIYKRCSNIYNLISECTSRSATATLIAEITDKIREDI